MIIFNSCDELRIEVMDGSLIRLIQASPITGVENVIDIPAERIVDVVNALKSANEDVVGGG